MSSKIRNTAIQGMSHKECHAVVIADDLDCSGEMLNLGSPTCLVEVGGAPILDYVIRLIDIPRISKIFILTKDHRSKIESFIEARNISTPIEIFSFENCYSFGDWMRGIHSMDILKDYFVLLRGNCIPHFELSQAIEEFEKRKKLDKMIIMMKLFTRGASKDSRRNPSENTCVMVNKDNIIKYYDSIGTGTSFNITENPRMKFKDITDFKVIYNAYDTHISLCTPNLLTYFMDNFDFNHERDEFLKELLPSELYIEEVLYHELESIDYVRVISNAKDLWRVNIDALQRQFPTYLNFNSLLKQRSKLKYVESGGYNSWISVNSNIDYNVKIARNCLIRDGSKLGEGVAISNSIIGMNCIVDQNVQLENTILMDDAVIKEGSKLKNCFVGKEGVINKNSKLISSIIDMKTEVAEQSSFNLIWKNEDGEETVDDNKKFLELIATEDAEFVFEKDDVEEDDAEKQVSFEDEVKEMINRGIEDGQSVNDISRELNNLRMGENKSFFEVIEVGTSYILIIIAKKMEGIAASDYLQTLTNQIIHWKDFFKKFISNEDELDVLLGSVEDICNEKPILKIPILLQVLFLQEICTGISIIRWYDNKEGLSDEFSIHCISSCKEFYEWLKSEEESSSSDGSGSDEGSDSEEDD